MDNQEYQNHGQKIDELEEANAKLQGIMDNIPGALTIFVMDKTGILRLEYISDGCEQIFGFTAAEMMERYKDDILIDAHPDDKEELIKIAVDSFHNRTPARYSYRSYCKDGKYKWVSMNVSPITSNGVLKYYGVCTDISAIMEQEHQLQIRDETTKLLLNASNMIVVDMDLKNHCMTFSYMGKEGERIEEKADYLSEQVKSAVYPEDWKVLEKVYRKAAESAQTGAFEYRADYQGKGYEWFSLTYRSFSNIEGKVYRILGKAENIQKQKELENRFNEEVLKRTSLQKECLAAFNLDLTADKLTYYESDQLGHIPPNPGISCEQALAYLAAEIPNEAERAEFQRIFSRENLLHTFQNNEKYVEMEYRREDGYGSVIWMRTVTNIIVQPRNQNMIAFLYTFNIHDRKLHEITMENILQKDYEVILLIDEEKNQADTLSVCDGYDDVYLEHVDDYDQAVKKYIMRRCVHENPEKITEKLMLRTIIGKLAVQEEYNVYYPIRMPDKSIRREKASFFYVDKENHYLVETRMNMTEAYEEEEKRNEILKSALTEAKNANKAKTDFLSRMSHDIRTPMNAIIGMTHLAKDEENLEVIQEYLNNIDSSSEFLLGLINDILDLSKIESGELKLKPEPCHVEEFEKGINTIIRPLMEKKNIEFVFEMNCGATCLLIDGLRFNQIFFNLLSNAAKFTPEGGKVEFLAEHIPPREGIYGARYIVRDNGIGMSEEFLPHVFESFSQEKIDQNGKTSGTGLGLPIVKSLVEAMDGTISVKSTLGVGTEFVLDLYTPLAVNDEKTDNCEKENASLENAEILMAEDNDLNILVARKLLEKKGCHVTVAKNGKQAISLFDESEIGFYDAILMDVRMPVMNGLEATKRIRSLDRTDAREIPIIAMTADAFMEEQKRTLEAEMNYHLAKPIEPTKLYQALEKHMKKKHS